MSIDLGQKMEVSEPMPISKDTMYPTFYIRGEKSLDLPEEGEMTICFRRLSETKSTDKDGKTRYECCLEVQSIEEVEGEDEVEAPAKSYDEAGEALDKLAAKVHERMKPKSEEY